MSSPTLILESAQATPLNTKFQLKELKLGDGYEQVASVGKSGILLDYNISTDHISVTDSQALVGQLLNWRGVQSFYWAPRAGVLPKLFICQQWQVILVSQDERQITGTFQEVIV